MMMESQITKWNCFQVKVVYHMGFTLLIYLHDFEAVQTSEF